MCDLLESYWPPVSPARVFALPMTPQNTLDHKGNFSANPFAELLVEIRQAGLGGSMRLARRDAKAIIYFRDGEVVYGVSNSREHRLFHILLELRKIEQSSLAGLPKCTNDVELAAMLVKQNVLSRNEVDAAVVIQLERILIDALGWQDAEWHYSPLVRSREDLAFPIDARRVLIDYGRCQSSAFVLARFKSVQEKFERVSETDGDNYLQNHEEFVLKTVGTQPRTIEALTVECGLPENGLIQALYVLWLGGLLRRREWNAAFSENRIAAIRNAKVSLVKQAQKSATESSANVGVPTEPADQRPEPVPEAPPAKQQAPEITLDEYLTRVAEGATHYDVLGIPPRAAIAEIKASYFLLAKLFHPDRFHRESPAALQKIQAAFSRVQAAYETLKSSDSRDNYDFKIRKELEMKEKLRAQGVTVADVVDTKAEQGLESFEAGLSLLMDEEYERAIPFLGRAAHYNPDNALYRAYFGKALSYDENQRHKAEGEMQAAARIDPKNPKIRLMLVEFFMENNLLKRAEGELKRFLEIAPDNAEAKRLLAKIQN